MNRLQIMSLFVAFALSLPFAKSETIYIELEEGCMERYEYLVNENTKGDALISYQTWLSENKAAIFEIDKENKKWTRVKPKELYPCNDLRINQRMVEKINNGELKLFIVRSNKTHYNVSSVKKAIFYEQNSQTVEVSSKDADYIFSLTNSSTGIDIALPESDSDVFIEGKLPLLCTTGYIIKKSNGYRASNYKELTIVPEVGIVEKRAVTSSFRSGEKVNIIKLNKINSVPYVEFLNQKCTEIQAAATDRKDRTSRYEEDYTYSSSDRTRTNTSPSKSKSYTKNEVTESTTFGPCGKQAMEGIHIVENGQTLYSIARRYGVSVAQVKSWNDMNQSNIISPCQELYVLPPSTVNTKSTSSTEKEKTKKTWKRNSKEEVSTDNYRTDQDFHRVKRGESIRKLAQLYGYTEDRFRWMNGLDSNEDITSGQLLRTSDCVCPDKTTATTKRPQPYDVPSSFDDTSRLSTGFSSKSVEEKKPKGTKIYVVRQNDTLFSIAKAFNTSVEDLRKLNDLDKGEVILPAQQLYVQ